jgi:hypothetical protein
MTEANHQILSNWLKRATSHNRRGVLRWKRPGGGGKTTTLIQLATETQYEGEISFLIDLPAWVRAHAPVTPPPAA